MTETETFDDIAHELRLMKECLFQHFTVFGFQHHSPFKQIFDRQIARFLEAGILQNWFRDMTIKYGKSYMNHFFESNVARSNEPIVLTLEHVSGAFYFLIIGAIISTIVFGIEILYKKIKK